MENKREDDNISNHTKHTNADLTELPDSVLTRLQNLKEEDSVSEQQGAEAEEFIYKLHCVRDDQIGEKRLLKYLSQLSMIYEKIDFSLKTASVEKFNNELIPAIKKEDVSPSTKRDRRVAISKFYKTIWPVNGQRPRWVWEILESEITDLTHPKQSNLERDYDFIWPQEVLELVGAASNDRDALLPLFLYESGARISTVRELKYGEVIVHEDYVEFDLGNKKNKELPQNRTIYLTKCHHLVQEWIESHPTNDPDDFFFCRLEDSGYGHEGGNQLSRRSITNALDRLADRINLNKKNNAHAFRASMATYLKKIATHEGEGWTLNMIAERGGWGTTRTIRDSYLLDVDEINGNDRKRVQGVQEERDFSEDPLKSRTCPSCGSMRCPTRVICPNCGYELREAEVRMEPDREVVIIERGNERVIERDGDKQRTIDPQYA
jgi:site-specific recombinase XerD